MTLLQFRFTKTCSEALGKAIEKEDFSTVDLDDKSSKFQVLSSLNKEFQHSVHNSRLHEMATLDDLYLFYKVHIANNIFLGWEGCCVYYSVDWRHGLYFAAYLRD